MRKKQFLFLILLVSLFLSLNFVALATTSNADTIVYVTDTGDKYHLRSCHYLKSVNEFTLEQAVKERKEPCSYCNPPLPNFLLPTADTSNLYEAKASNFEAHNTNISSGYSTSHYTNTSSSNRSGSSDGYAGFSECDSLIMLAVAGIGYGVMRLVNKQPSTPQQQKPSFNADAWNIENYRKSKAYNSAPKPSQPLIEQQIPGMPDDTMVGSDGLPCEKKHSGISPWGDKYTVWYSENGSKYHTFWCEWHRAIPVNVVNVAREPCKVCRPKLPDLEWYYKYKSVESAESPALSPANNTQYLLVDDEDGFLMRRPATPPEPQHIDRTPEEIALHRQRVHDAIVNKLYSDDSNAK